MPHTTMEFREGESLNNSSFIDISSKMGRLQTLSGNTVQATLSTYNETNTMAIRTGEFKLPTSKQ